MNIIGVFGRKSLLSLCIVVCVLFAGEAKALDGWFDWYYGKISWNEEKSYLDNFGIYLSRDPEMIGYVGFFLGKGDDREKLNTRMECAKKYLISTFKLDRDRIQLIYAGKAEETKIILQPVSRENPPPRFSESTDP